MVMAFPVIEIESILLARGRVWRVDTFSGDIAAGGNRKIGITTGDDEVLISNRKYSTSVASCTISLHEVAFTGGSTPQMANRRLSSLKPVPATVLEGVTATVGDTIFSVHLRAQAATGNAQIAFVDTQDAVILEANTSYVVQLLNSSAATGQIDMQFDLTTTDRIGVFSEFGG